MSEEKFYRFILRMEREVYGKSSYIYAGETNLELWEKEEDDHIQ